MVILLLLLPKCCGFDNNPGFTDGETRYIVSVFQITKIVDRLSAIFKYGNRISIIASWLRVCFYGNVPLHDLIVLEHNTPLERQWT